MLIPSCPLQLWPHVQEFVDGAIGHVVNMVRVLGEQIGQGEPVWPHVIHGHYADAGDIAALLSGALNVPMVLTGHSLGRNKLEQLLKQVRIIAFVCCSWKFISTV
jgi:sucrose-phosphate synthase